MEALRKKKTDLGSAGVYGRAQNKIIFNSLLDHQTVPKCQTPVTH